MGPPNRDHPMTIQISAFPFPLCLVHTVQGPRLGWIQDGKFTTAEFDPKSLKQLQQYLTQEQIEGIGEINYAIGDAAAAALKAATRAMTKGVGPTGMNLNASPKTMDLLRQAVIEGLLASIQLTQRQTTHVA